MFNLLTNLFAKKHGSPAAAPAEPALAVEPAPPAISRDEPEGDGVRETAVAPRPAVDLGGAMLAALREAEQPDAVVQAATALWADAVRGAADMDEAGRSFLSLLRRQRLRVAARIAAQAAVEALPDKIWPLSDLATLLDRQGDHEACLKIGRHLEQCFSGSPEGPRIILRAYLGLRYQHEAERYFAALPEHWLSEAWCLEAGIKVAEGHGAGNDVLAYGERLRAAAPANPLGYVAPAMELRGRGDLEAAEALLCEAMRLCPNAQEVWREAAGVAEALHHEEDAFARWAAFRSRFSRSAAGFTGAIQLSRRLQQPEKTERLLNEALAAFPKNKDLLTSAAEFFGNRREYDRARGYWQTLASLSPEDPAIRVRGAMAHIGPAVRRKSRMPEVLERLEEVHALFPEYAPAYGAYLEALQDVPDLDKAAALGARWGERFPADARLATARARVAEAQGKPEDALAYVARARALAPGNGALEAAYVRALTAVGRVEEAEAACAAALEKAPDSLGLLKEYVGLATRRDDWQGALNRALLAQRRRPADLETERMVRRARAQLIGDPDAPDADAAPGADEGPKPASAALLSRYESLGATTGGCEFGLVQRRFGTEPLGLLRWARIDLEGVITNLLNQFDGMGLPENTQLVVQRASASHQEYFIADKRSGYWTHTFVHVEHAEFDRMYKQSVRRVAFLRDKLLEELRTGTKIYAFKATHRPSDADLYRLHDALCTYGNYRLLIVTLAASKADIGKLTMLRPGLFVGESGMFMDAGIARERGIDTELWHYFCEQVAQWCDAHPVDAHDLALAK